MKQVAVVAGALLVTTALAHAQQGEPMPPPPPQTAPIAPQPIVDPTANDYDQGFRLLADGHPEQAATIFNQVAAQSPDPLRAASARELARLATTLSEKHARYTMGTADQKLKAELAADDNDDGRTSFITFSTLYGLYAGVVLIDDFDISDFRAGIATVAATTAVGLLGSYFGTKDVRITGAMGDAYGVGMMFGVANAALLIEPIDNGVTDKEAFTTVLIAGGVGGVLGLEFAAQAEPTRGQVSFASTLGILGFASTGLAIAIAQPDGDGDHLLVAMAGGMDLGLTAGLVVGKDLDWSVSRGRIVTLGTLLGGLAGAAGGALIVGSDPSNDGDRVIAAATLIGTWGGFGLTTHLTSDMRPDRRYAQSTTQLTAIPVRNGMGLGFTGQF
jgi:hypothetical protein